MGELIFITPNNFEVLETTEAMTIPGQTSVGLYKKMASRHLMVSEIIDKNLGPMRLMPMRGRKHQSEQRLSERMFVVYADGLDKRSMFWDYAHIKEKAAKLAHDVVLIANESRWAFVFVDSTISERNEFTKPKAAPLSVEKHTVEEVMSWAHDNLTEFDLISGVLYVRNPIEEAHAALRWKSPITGA